MEQKNKDTFAKDTLESYRKTLHAQGFNDAKLGIQPVETLRKSKYYMQGYNECKAIMTNSTK